MDTNQEIKDIRAALEELTASIQVLSDKQNAQFTELMLAIKKIESHIVTATEDVSDDEVYEEAKNVVIESGKASTSFIQRKLRIGYSRAARLMDVLEERRVIGPAIGSEPRVVLAEE